MPRTRATPVLVVLLVAVYLVQQLVPLTEGFAFVAADVLRRPWTLLTSIFLHSRGDYMHLLNNLFFLGLFGYMLERTVGTRRFVGVFLVAGVLANLSAFVFYPATPVLGASGAISGVVAAMAVIRPRAVGLLWGVPAPMWVVLLGWLGLNLLGMGSPGNIAFAAHVAGLAVGMAAGAMHRDRPDDADGADAPDVDVEAWEERYMRRDA